MSKEKENEEVKETKKDESNAKKDNTEKKSDKTKTNTKKTGSRKQSSTKKVQETKSTNENSKRVRKDEHEIDISPYVSNVDGNVYAISGLPEEFIATLFAWVSRSSKSFKEHLKTALKDHDVKGNLDSFKELDKKAKKFHEKWTVGYGHSSVAEHAFAHVGIENISRLASAELELANTFLSITEYSQRYQKPERGKWYNPFEKFITHSGPTRDMKINPLYKEVEEFYDKSFDIFEKLIDGVYDHLKKEYHQSKEFKDLKKEQENNGKDIKALEKIDKKLKLKYNAFKKLAFEDARYVLPLSMHTQLGMTANGRAWRDALAVLGNSDHQESQQLADDLRTEISKVLPVLLKYATPSQYQKNAKKRIQNVFNQKTDSHNSDNDVYLSSVVVERNVIDEILAHLKVQQESTSYINALAYVKHNMKSEEKESIIKDLLFEMEHFDQAPEAFKHVQYEAHLKVSEANWHQLLRHNRKTDFTYGKPTPYFGVTIPPRIVEAGLQDIVKDSAHESEELYNRLQEKGFETEAEYVVLNAHKRNVSMSFNLWEAYHLINLRTDEDAQWDIRETFNVLYKQLSTVHPLLMSQAKRRIK